MFPLLLSATVLLAQVHCFPWWTQYDPEIKMTVPEIIRHWGYPVEVHYAVTQDGYILELHRIPYGKAGPTSNTSRPVVFLQHGLESSSSDWVVNLPEQAAGFVLADAGFDVWMGNMRGNKYSRNHIHLNPLFSGFWDFTWDKMAQYDLPAMINQALVVSGHPHVYYVGYSQGTLTMFAKLSADPSFSKKIKMFFALAPIGSVAHIEGLLRTLVTDFSTELAIWTKLFGSGEFLPNNFLIKSFTSMACGYGIQREICEHVLFAITGPDTKGMNTSRIPVYMSHTPSGTSSLNILHWIQMVKTGSVSMFDYGDAKNVAVYGQKSPPAYKFGDISNVPIYLFTGGNDRLANEQDVKGYLIPHLGPLLQENTHLADYNHLDFIWGLDAATDVYHPIASRIRDNLKSQSADNSTIHQ